MIQRRIRKQKKEIVVRSEVKHDFLKNWGLVRKFTMYEYDIKKVNDLEMILYLYGEHLFNRTTFREYANFMPWDKDRFNRLYRYGFISKWRTKGFGEAELFELSPMAKKMVSGMHKKLLGIDMFPETNLRIYNQTATFSQKTVAIAVKRFNNKLKERKQRPSLESPTSFGRL
jgi:hypothetical protein